jgi:MbtH protein
MQDARVYRVVVNHEGQYSVWLADRDNPTGWRDAGKTGTKAECLAFVKEVWTDMRPLSLRRTLGDLEPVQPTTTTSPAQSPRIESPEQRAPQLTSVAA